ncbi:MAG: hypothetical protein KDC12_04065 [Flavobacteriales bacterium]|nr:hypothetical protein [Flavobacteriales bacterium]
MQDKLYDLDNLKKEIGKDANIPPYIQDFITNTLGKDFHALQLSYAQQQKYQTHQMAHKLKFSLYMYGVHSIQKDLDKIELLCQSSEHFSEIGPLINNIKNHLRRVKNQMIDDFKMVITLLD